MSGADDISRRLEAVCESAVSPLEIASALEFEGFSDRAVRDGYGADDVFALARDLYDRVPRRPAPPPPGDDPRRPGRFTPLLHGVLYALPAICFPAARALLGGPGVVPVLVVALLAGWGLSQGLAAIGYRRLGSGGPAQAGGVLRAGLLAGLAVVGVTVTLAMLAAGARPPAAAFGAGEAAYMLGAAAAFVAGAERWLLAALAPAVAGSTVYLALGQPPGLASLAWAAIATAPAAACALALYPRAVPRGGPPPDAHPPVGYGGPGLAVPHRTELGAAPPAIAFAVLIGGLLVLPLTSGPGGAGGVGGVGGAGGLNPGAVAAAVPLALSMGAAEWSLLRYRRRGLGLLRSGGDHQWFARRARLAFAAALGRYAGVMIALVAAAAGIAAGADPAAGAGPVFAAAGGYALLGAALFCVLSLQTVGVRVVPLLACAAALAAEYALRHHGLAAQIAAPGALAAVMIVYATARAGHTTLHA